MCMSLWPSMAKSSPTFRPASLQQQAAMARPPCTVTKEELGNLISATVTTLGLPQGDEEVIIHR